MKDHFKQNVLVLSSKLLRFAVHFVGDREQAKDIVQDVFLKLWQKQEGLSKIDNLESFAIRMVRNRCLDWFRENRSNHIQNEKISELTIDLSSDFDISESAQFIRDAIRSLPELQQTIIWLRDVEQYEYEEIALITNLNINAIRVNLSRARKKVRDELVKHHNYGIETSKNSIERIL